MFNIKDIKIQKKAIYLVLTLVLTALFAYSGWFLYNNFYRTINWKDNIASSLQREAIIRHVDLNKMESIVADIEKEQEEPERRRFNINIEIR